MTAKQELLFDLPVVDRKTLTFAPIRNRIWTEQKASLISRYLRLFVLITKHGTYIDGFAGPQYPDKLDAWTAKLVIESEPRWLKSFFVCELDKSKLPLLQSLIDTQPKKPKRHFQVLDGDFNVRVHDVLASGKVRERIATFCLLDQRTFECDWTTVEALARAKTSEKIELMYFVPTGWLQRAISGLKDKSGLSKWWGRADWNTLADMNSLQCAQAFCERFKRDLGYKYATPWPIFEKEGGVGRIMYHLILATDHAAAPYLMSRAYRSATKNLPPQEQLMIEFEQLKSALATF